MASCMPVNIGRSAAMRKANSSPCPTIGLLAVTLILCIAFVLCSAFARLHCKLFRRYRLSMLEISRQLYCSLWSLQPPIRAPDG